MDFALSADQEELRSVFRRFLDHHSTTADVRAAEALGFDDNLWKRINDLGIPGMALAGADGEVANLSALVVVAEEFGRHLAAVPLIETLTAARALGRAGLEWTEGLVTFSPRAVSPDGAIRLLPAGAVADRVVALTGSTFVLADFTDDAPMRSLKNLGSLALANRVVASGGVELATGVEAAVGFERALDDWKVLTAAALVGLCDRAHEITVAYVKERTAFSVPIGWFQTVAHRLADHINDLDGARFLVHKAAWAVDSGDHRAAELVSMAFAYASSLAERLTADCLHFHGGIGYTLEHDIQLFFRRAKAWPLVLGDPKREYAVLADRMFPRPAA